MTVLWLIGIIVLMLIDLGVRSARNWILAHKESPWTYPRLHKCRCGGKPEVKWAYSPSFDYGTGESNGLKGFYEVRITCTKCGFSIVAGRHYNLPSKGNNFKTIPDTGSINKANMKAIRAWNKTSPEKCEECDQ